MRNPSRLIVAVVCSLALLSSAARLRADDAMGNTIAKVVTEWSVDRTQCHISVVIYNLTKDKLFPIEETAKNKKTTFREFPKVLKASVVSETGKPELPYVTVNLEVPTNSSLSWLADEISTADTWKGVDIIPARAPWAETPGAERPALTPNMAIYGKNHFFPGRIVELGPKQEMRGSVVQALYLYPIQYNPALSTVQLFRKFKITAYVSTDSARDGGVGLRADFKDSENTRNLKFSTMFGNSYATLVNGFNPPLQADLPSHAEDSAGCDYLIIIDDKLVAKIDPLVQQKKGKGLSVRMVTLSDLAIGNSDDAESRRTKIRARIDAEYKKSPVFTYLLLVGDAQAIPPYLKTSHPEYPPSLKIATDLYYATLGGPDLIPEILIGRLPARSPEELDVMVSKILTYDKEVGKHADGQAWGSALVSAEYENEPSGAGTTFTERWFQQTAYNVGEFFAHAPAPPVFESPNFKTTRQYYVAGQPDLAKPWLNRDGTPIPQEVINDFTSDDNAKSMIKAAWKDSADPLRLLLHRDHGFRSPTSGGWGLPSFTIADVGELEKPALFPVVLSINCETGWYDMSGGPAMDDHSLALALMRSPNGASAVIGASRISWSKYNDRLTEGIIEAMWSRFQFDFELPEVEAGKRIGQALQFAKTYFYNIYHDDTADMTMELFNLFGDPEMRITAGSTAPAPEIARGGGTDKAWGPATRVLTMPQSFKKGYK